MKFRWDKKYLYAGVTAFCVIACSVLFFFIVRNWQSFKRILAEVRYVFSPIIIALAVAYLLRPGLNAVERKFFKPLAKRFFKDNERKCFALSRSLGITTMVLLLFIILAGMVMLVLPQLYMSIEKLAMNMDNYVANVREWMHLNLTENPQLESTLQNWIVTVMDYAENWLTTSLMSRIDTILVSVTSGLRSVIMALFHFFIGVIASVYLLYNKEKYSAQGKKLLYCLFKTKTANGMLEAIRKSDEMFVGFFGGKLLDSAIIGVICTIFTSVAQMPYFSLVSVIVGVTNIIPFFGPYIGAVPCAFIILLESPLKCLVFIIFCLLLQTFDGNILGPKILGNKTNLSSFWVVFAILVSGGFFGFPGMVCGVPVFAVIYYFCQRGIRRRLHERALSAETEDYMSLAYVDEENGEMVMKEPKPEAGSRKKKAK